MVHGHMRFTMVLVAVALGSAGCVATESWGLDQLKPIQAQVAQLTTDTAQEKAGLAQVNTRVTQVDGRVTQVDDRLTQVATDLAATRKVADGAAVASAPGGSWGVGVMLSTL
jgi:septal ring factor EnvC (AmiA/AmiB activator)